MKPDDFQVKSPLRLLNQRILILSHFLNLRQKHVVRAAALNPKRAISPGMLRNRHVHIGYGTGIF